MSRHDRSKSNYAKCFRNFHFSQSAKSASSYYNLSNVCLFVCSPTPPRSLGRSSPNLDGRWRAAPDISLRGSFFERSRSSRSKVKFMFFYVCSPISPRSLGRSSPNLLGRLRAAPDISSRGSFFERSRSSRSKVKFLYLGSPWSNLHETW